MVTDSEYLISSDRSFGIHVMRRSIFFVLQSCSGVKVIWRANRQDRRVVRHAVQTGGHQWRDNWGESLQSQWSSQIIFNTSGVLFFCFVMTVRLLATFFKRHRVLTVLLCFRNGPVQTWMASSNYQWKMSSSQPTLRSTLLRKTLLQSPLQSR